MSGIYAGYYATLRMDGYLTFSDISSYDPQICASKCDNMTGCKSYTIYFERNPLVLPAPACPDPAAAASIRCAFYAQVITPIFATNVGQWRQDFGVVIAGANAYNKASSSFAPATSAASMTSSVPSASSSPASSKISTTTSSSATSSSSVAPVSTPSFGILAANYADKDISSFARSNWLVGKQVVVDTNATAIQAANGDPWSSNPTKTISMLYTWGSETRVFVALPNSGSFTQQNSAYNASTAPGSTLAGGTAIPPPSDSTTNIMAVTYGSVQFANAPLYAKVYKDAGSSSGFLAENNAFGNDPNYGIVKTMVVFHRKNGSSSISVATARENTALFFLGTFAILVVEASYRPHIPSRLRTDLKACKYCSTL